jgi:hypothetical protein
MGMVVEAHDIRQDRPVAIKFLRGVDEDELLDRFEREVRLLASLSHPHVVRVLALERIGSHPVLVLELLTGGTLKDRLRQRGTLPPAEAVGVMLDILAGLEALHQRGIVHRDLKPENVLFSGDGTAKLADLGIAKDHGAATITAIGQVLGTPLYMSPEQARGDPTSLSCDIYALGCMLYELLAGRPPFVGNPLALIRAHLDLDPPPLAAAAPDVPERLVAVVHRCLAKRSADRPPGCAELSAGLKRALGIVEGASGAALNLPKKPSQPVAAAAPAPAAPQPAAATHLALPLAEPAGAAAVTSVSAPTDGPVWTCTVELTQTAGPPPRTVVVGPGPTFIGRTPGPSEIVLDDPGVSYRHVLLVPDGDDLQLLDFKSTNGVKINGERVERHTLADGDRLTVGLHLLTLRRTWPHGRTPADALMSGELLADWIAATGTLRDRATVLLEELVARWRLARALVLAEHRASASFPLLAAAPAGELSMPDALSPARLASGLSAPEPLVDGLTAFVPLRSAGRPVGALWLERGPGTPDALLTASGQQPLAALGTALALAIEVAALRGEEMTPWRS